MTKADLIKKSSPAAAKTAYPDAILDLQVQFTALLAKLDASTEITATDWGSTCGLANEWTRSGKPRSRPRS
jgi:hypothetical protein